MIWRSITVPRTLWESTWFLAQGLQEMRAAQALRESRRREVPWIEFGGLGFRGLGFTGLGV